MRLHKFYYFMLFSILLGTVVNALAEESLKIVKAVQPDQNSTTLSTGEVVKPIDEPTQQVVEVVVESQGHQNVGERKARQFGYPGFGYSPFIPRPYYGGGFGGGFGGGYGGGGFGGGGFQRTRVVTRTRVVNRVRGGGYYGGGGGGFFG